MTNLEKANKETLTVLHDTQWYFIDIDTLYDDNGNPLLLYHEKKYETECFIYPVAWTRKFFIETRVDSNGEYTTTRPWVAVMSYNDDTYIDWLFTKYPNYWSIDMILDDFFAHTMPTLLNYQRDRILYIEHCTDIKQRNVGRLELNSELLEKFAQYSISIVYAVKIY